MEKCYQDKCERILNQYMECVYDERDIISDFLTKQASVSYGTQMFAWAIWPHQQLRLMDSADEVEISYIIGNSNDSSDVRFHGELKDYHCWDFEFGELRKIINILPDPDKLNRINAVSDLISLCRERSLEFEADEQLETESGDICHGIYIADDGKIHAHMTDVAGNTYERTILPETDFAIRMRNHAVVSVLHRSEDYKKLMNLLDTEENLCFNFVEAGAVGQAEFAIDGTDCTFEVLDVSRDDGHLFIYGNMCRDGEYYDSVQLKEEDIKPEYLGCIVKVIQQNRTGDIMDDLNGHNPELVKRINQAWRNDKESFSPILHALYERDNAEYQDKYDSVIHSEEDILLYAHEIIEGICDDEDLKTILSFLRV